MVHNFGTHTTHTLTWTYTCAHTAISLSIKQRGNDATESDWMYSSELQWWVLRWFQKTFYTEIAQWEHPSLPSHRTNPWNLSLCNLPREAQVQTHQSLAGHMVTLANRQNALVPQTLLASLSQPGESSCRLHLLLLHPEQCAETESPQVSLSQQLTKNPTFRL